MPGPAPRKRKPDPHISCSVCGRVFRSEKAGRSCTCPWDKAFEHWPEKLRNVIRSFGPSAEVANEVDERRK